MSRSHNSRRGIQKAFPGVCRTECRVCQNFDRRVELSEAHEAKQAQRALLDHGEPCPDGCCPHMPDVDLLDFENERVLEECDCFDDYVCRVCSAMWPSEPLRVTLLESL